MSIAENGGPVAPSGDSAPDEVLTRAQHAAMSAVRAGQFAPTFRLRDMHGGNRALIELIDQGPLVLSFYRGVWCDFCGDALAALSGLDGSIRALGATQVAIGPAPSSAVQRSRLEAFPMPLLVDRGLRVAAAYGLTISLPESARDQYARLGYVPLKIGETSEWKIAVPATYVVNSDGRIVLAMIDADYRNRVQSNSLLSALDGLQRRRFY